METVGIEAPADRRAKSVRRGVVLGTLVLVVAAALGGGFALGTSSADTAPQATFIVRGPPATWGDALAEANAIKRQAAARAQADRLDIRKARVER